MKSLIRKIGRGQKGFTLIEVLVVVAILGVLAAVAVPAVSSFIDDGDESAAETELHDVQTAVTAMMVAAGVGTLDGLAAYDDVNDMATVTAGSGAYTVADYMVGLDGTETKIGYYDITLDGKVTIGTAP